MSEKKPVKDNSWSNCGIAIVVLSCVLGFPFVYNFLMKSPESTEKTKHIGTAKNICMALFSFAKDHDGLYPCDKTGPAATAEDCFNQLLTGGYLENEEIFWNKKFAKFGVVEKNQPNNDGVLTAGENCWGYVKGLSTSSRVNVPVLFDSSLRLGEFNTEVWEGDAIIARLDGSVQALTISTGSSNTKYGQVHETIGSQKVDIFKALPETATILPPQAAK